MTRQLQANDDRTKETMQAEGGGTVLHSHASTWAKWCKWQENILTIAINL